MTPSAPRAMCAEPSAAKGPERELDARIHVALHPDETAIALLIAAIRALIAQHAEPSDAEARS